MQANIWKYYVYSFLGAFTFFSGVLIPFFTQWGGIGRFEIQFLQAWFMVWIFILEVPTGAVADYFGRKYSIILGLVLFGVGNFIYGSVPNFWIFLLGEFILAAGLALQSGADEALLYDSLKSLGREDEAKKITGRVRSVELIAMGISAPVGSLIAVEFGLNAPMILTGFSMMLAGLVAVTLKEPAYQNKKSESPRYLEIVKSGLDYVREHPSLKRIALNGVLVAASGYFVIWTYQNLLQKLTIPIVWFGVFHLMLVVVQIAISNTFNKMEQLVGSTSRYLQISAMLVGAGFLLVSLKLNVVSVVVFIVLSGGFGLTRMTYLSAHLNKLILSETRATVLSLMSMFRRFFLVILNPLVGYFIDKSLVGTLVVLGLIPVLVVMFLPIRGEAETGGQIGV